MRAAGAQCSCRTALAIAVRWLATAAGLKKDLVSRPPAMAGHRGALLQGLVVLTRAHRFAKTANSQPRAVEGWQ
jgi:hypothetical protein